MHGRNLLVFDQISDFDTRVISVHHWHVDIQKHKCVLAITVPLLENFLKRLGAVDGTVHFEFIGFQH